GGLDLASTTDMAAYSLVFPGAPVRALMRYFLPEADLRERVLRDRVPYDVWADQGLLTLTPGNAIDYAWIKRALLEDAERFGLRELAFDRWTASQIITELQDEGLTCVGSGQGFASMPAPSKHLEHLVTTGDLAHGGHPILRWNARNASAKLDPAGNVKPDKSTSTGRIDGLVAMIMGLGRLIVQPAE